MPPCSYHVPQRRRPPTPARLSTPSQPLPPSSGAGSIAGLPQRQADGDEGFAPVSLVSKKNLERSSPLMYNPRPACFRRAQEHGPHQAENRSRTELPGALRYVELSVRPSCSPQQRCSGRTYAACTVNESTRSTAVVAGFSVPRARRRTAAAPAACCCCESCRGNMPRGSHSTSDTVVGGARIVAV